MPSTKQASKRMKQDERRRQANKAARSAMRSAVKKVLQAPSPEEAEKALPEAMRKVDKAAKRHVIHANTAARKKSQLTRAARGK